MCQRYGQGYSGSRRPSNGEHAENLIRKDFTVSERVAIGKSMAARLGERQGQRTDLEHVQNFAQVDPGEKTRDLAADKSGLGSHFTYQQAEKVCDEAVPELVALMKGDEPPFPPKIPPKKPKKRQNRPIRRTGLLFRKRGDVP